VRGQIDDAYYKKMGGEAVVKKRAAVKKGSSYECLTILPGRVVPGDNTSTKDIGGLALPENSTLRRLKWAEGDVR